MRTYFNDDNTNKGVEGWYEITDGKLAVYIKATNCWEDWLSNFTAFPRWWGYAKCFIHAGYYNYAKWLNSYIDELCIDNEINIDDVYLFGYSMGGGIAQIVGLDKTVNVISIDGPRTTSKVSDNMTLIYNRGSLVHNLPFWFKKINRRICNNPTWRWFWKSHADYDIDAIIEEYA